MSLRVHSAGSVEFLTPGNPTFLWNTGQTETLWQLGPGWNRGDWFSDQRIDRLTTVPLVCKRGVLAPGGMTNHAAGIFVLAAGAIAWSVRSMVEVPGAPSTVIPQDVPFDFAWIEIGNREDSDAGIAAACSIEYDSLTNVTNLRTNSGAFRQVVKTGVGDYLLETEPESGFDASQVAFFATPRGQTYPGNARVCGVDHVSDTQKRITILESPPGGIPSVLVDTDVDLIVIAKDAPRKPHIGYPDLRSCRLHSAACWEGGGTPSLLINSGEWQEPVALPAPGDNIGTLQSGSGLTNSDGVFVTTTYDTTHPNARWTQVNRPGGVVPTDARVVEVITHKTIGGAMPGVVGDFIISIVGVACSS